MKRHLVVMVKAPRIGQVKTRLGREIGYLKAWGAYRRMLGDILRLLARDERWITSLAVTPDAAHTKRRLWPLQTQRLAQGSGDLGKRMGRVMDVMPPGPVVIIGADIPGIQPHHIWSAFTALGKNDAVFGPAEDGGYWLVGLRRRPIIKNIFKSIRWSTAYALADTRRNLPDRWQVVLLGVLMDVDDSRTFKLLRKQR